MLNVVLHFDLVDDVAFGRFSSAQQRCCGEMREHGCAQASGIVERDYFLAFGSELFAHAVDQVNFRADSKHGWI